MDENPPVNGLDPEQHYTIRKTPAATPAGRELDRKIEQRALDRQRKKAAAKAAQRNVLRYATAKAGSTFFGLAALEALFLFIIDGHSVAEQAAKYFGPQIGTVYVLAVVDAIIAIYYFFAIWRSSMEDDDD